MRISDWSSDVCSSDLGRRLADALQAADEGDVDGDQVAGATGLDVALAELAAEALQETDLLVAEGDLALGGGLLQTQQALVAGQQAVAGPTSRAPRRRRPASPPASAPGQPAGHRGWDAPGCGRGWPARPRQTTGWGAVPGFFAGGRGSPRPARHLKGLGGGL